MLFPFHNYNYVEPRKAAFSCFTVSTYCLVNEYISKCCGKHINTKIKDKIKKRLDAIFKLKCEGQFGSVRPLN